MNRWLSTLHFFLPFVISVVIAGCGTTSSPVVLSSIGPAPIERTDRVLSDGQLQVYTATEEHDEDAVYYYPHSAYTIFRPNGDKVRQVRNQTDRYDETPQVVPLAPGRYMVRARADGYGYVAVPVIIEAGRRTSVHLDRTRRLAYPDSEGQLFVRLPDGRAVGWRAVPF